MDQIIERLGRALQARPVVLPDFKALVADTEKSLSDNQAKLPAESLSALKKRLEADNAALAKASSSAETWQRAHHMLSIAADLQQIQDRVALLAAGKTTAVSMSDRETQIDQQIADALVSGILTPDEAHRFKAELEAIIAEGKNGAANDEKTSDAEQPQR